MEKSGISPGLLARMALDSEQFRYTESLGQNFLLDDAVINHMLDVAGIGDQDQVLEIGPGAGVMTAHIAERAARVVAVEIDRSLSPVLERVLSGYANSHIVYADALRLDLGALAAEHFQPLKYRVIANLPYYITSDLLLKFVSVSPKPDEIAVMVQKEAAARIMSSPGEKSYCALAAHLQAYGMPEVLLELPPRLFMPSPHVDSSFLSIKKHSTPPAAPLDERLFQRLIDVSFAMRRKTLVNNLKSAFSTDKARAEAWLMKAELPLNTRGETLSLAQLGLLSDAMTGDGVR